MAEEAEPTPGGAGAGEASTSPEATGPNADRAGRAGGLRGHLAAGEAAGAHAASTLGQAAAAVHLDVAATGLTGRRALLGHVLGLHQELRAGGLHGPRQAPVVAYLFADGLAVRPTDDAPMSSVPLLGLHLVLPPLAVTRWLYKAGRVEHANVDLLKVARTFEAALPEWTLDDFAEADPKLEAYPAAALQGAAHVYEHLGFAHLSLSMPDADPLRLKSTLPVTPEAFARLWRLCSSAQFPGGIEMSPPPAPGGPRRPS